MAKVGQDNDKEQKGGTRPPRGLYTDKTRLMDGRGPGRGTVGAGGCGGHVASYRKRDGGHFSQRGRPFPVHDHHETQTKMADSGKKTGERGNETGKRPGEIRSERGKWGKTEIKRRETEGGREAEKGRSPRDGTTGPPSSIGVSLFFLFRRTPPFHPCCSRYSV